MSDIIYLNEDDKKIVKKHIIHRIPTLIHSSYQVFSSIGSFITEEDVQVFTDACVRSVAIDDDAQVIDSICREYANMKDDIAKMFNTRLDAWVSRSSGRQVLADAAGRIRQALAEDIPF